MFEPFSVLTRIHNSKMLSSMFPQVHKYDRDDGDVAAADNDYDDVKNFKTLLRKVNTAHS